MASAQDDELSAIRARRLKAIQEQAQEQAITQMEAEEEAQKAAQTAAEIDTILRRALTPDARSRIARIALVEPSRASSIKTAIATMYQDGKEVGNKIISRKQRSIKNSLFIYQR